MSEKPRRWFRFTLRTYFVLLTVFGVWLGVQVKWIQDRQQLLDREKAIWEEVWGSSGDVIVTGTSAPGMLRLFGVNGVNGVSEIGIIVPATNNAPTEFDDRVGNDAARLDAARRLFPEADVHPIALDVLAALGHS